jgi:hypothetical protein
VDDLALIIGKGGWFRVVASDLPAPVYARAVVDEASGRWRVGELHVMGETPLTVEGMRAIPLARLEAALNEVNMAATLTNLMREMPHDEAREADIPRVALGALVPEPPPNEEPVSLLGGGVSREGEGGPLAAYYANRAMVVSFPVPSFKVKVPKGRKRPDHFYREVASAFSFASATGPRPAARIAKANRVPPSTVHRWIKEARRRGVMAPARQPTKRRLRTDKEQG